MKLLNAARGSFANVCQKYGLIEISHRREQLSIDFRVANTTSGIIVEVERCEVFVSICQLVDGAFPQSPGEISPATVLRRFDLIDIVSLSNKEMEKHLLSLTPVAFEPRAIACVLNDFANATDVYAANILNGDFSIFRRLDNIVKKRARAAAIAKWGKEASKFGWS